MSKEGTSPTGMPVALQQLTAVVESVEAECDTIPSYRPRPYHTDLQQIDHLQSLYQELLRFTIDSYSPGAAQSSAIAVQETMQKFEATIAEIQKGIRSKVSQTGRMALIDYLRLEVNRRQTAAEKMETKLEYARKV